MHSVITAVGASATVWVLVSACDATIGVGGNAAVSKDALQTDIANRLAKAGEQPQSVTCKEDLIGEVGRTARCDVVMSPTNTFEPVITVTGVDGNTINYEMTPALSKEQLERAVSRLVTNAGGLPVDSLSCESGLEGEVGKVTYCDIDAGGVKLRRTVEVNTVEGLMMNFDVVPVLTKAEVERSLLNELEIQTRRRPDSARCSGNLEGRPGNTVECTVVSGPDTASFILMVTTIEDDKIDYSYTPPP